MSGLPASLARKLEKRKSGNSFRELQLIDGKTDFYSNDYLGLCTDKTVGTRAAEILQFHPYANGSSGSRLLSGNSRLAVDSELFLQNYYEAESALIFNSGFDANLGLIASVALRNDTILYDELCHASIRDGIRLSLARSFSFRHNDPEDLVRKLQHAAGSVYVVTESVFSMDGDKAPLKELNELAQKHNYFLIVDEAHAVGCIGEGRGLAFGLDSVFARVATFGKAMGIHGAAILGSKELRDYLVNFSRPFIYSTALPPHAYALIIAAHERAAQMTEERKHLAGLVNYFHKLADERNVLISDSETPVQAIICPGNSNVKELAAKIQIGGIRVAPIISPTVPEGRERIRVCLHTYNTEQEILQLFQMISNA